MSDTETKYHLLYDFTAESEGFTADDVPEGHGACTAGVFMSLIYPPDGSYSSLLVSIDGRTGEELPPLEEFKAWVVASLALAKKLPRGEPRQILAQLTFEAWTKMIQPDLDIEKWRSAHGLSDPITTNTDDKDAN